MQKDFYTVLHQTPRDCDAAGWFTNALPSSKTRKGRLSWRNNISRAQWICNGLLRSYSSEKESTQMAHHWTIWCIYPIYSNSMDHSAAGELRPRVKALRPSWVSQHVNRWLWVGALDSTVWMPREGGRGVSLKSFLRLQNQYLLVLSTSIAQLQRN